MSRSAGGICAKHQVETVPIGEERLNRPNAAVHSGGLALEIKQEAGSWARLIRLSLPPISSALTPSTSARAVRLLHARSGFQSALRDLIPRCETFQGFCRFRSAVTCGAMPICRG